MNMDIITPKENNLQYSQGTFEDLSQDIENSGDELNLTRDYVYTTSDPSSVGILKSITINGNGHTIDGNNASIIHIFSDNVTLKNLKLVNFKERWLGGFITWKGDNGIFSNCSGNSNSIWLEYSKNFNVSDCNFTNNVYNMTSIQIHDCEQCVITNRNFEYIVSYQKFIPNEL